MEFATEGLRKLIAETRSSELGAKMADTCDGFEAAADLLDALQAAVYAGLVSANDARSIVGLEAA